MPEPRPKNAATLLADLLESLQVPANTYAQTVHGFGSDDDDHSTAWQRHIDALTLVRTVEETLCRMHEEGQPVGMFMRSAESWYKAVGMATNPWGSTANKARNAINGHDLELLRALGMLLDAQGSLTLGEQERRTLTDVLTEADELVRSDTSIPGDIRHYIETLIARARMLLDNVDTYGAEAVRSAAMELGGAMVMQGQRAAEAGDKPTSKRWFNAAYLAMAGFVGGVGEGAGQDALHAGGQALGQLLGGS